MNVVFLAPMNFLQFCLRYLTTLSIDCQFVVALEFLCSRLEKILIFLVQGSGKVAQIIQPGLLPGRSANRVEVANQDWHLQRL